MMFFSQLNNHQLLREIWLYLKPFDIYQLLKVDNVTRNLCINLNKIVSQELSLGDLDEFDEEEKERIMYQLVLCFPKLSKVDFSGGMPLNKSLKKLFNLKSVCESIEELHVKIFDDSETEKINKLSQLKSLKIRGSKISKRGLENICKIDSITSLDISNCHYLHGSDFPSLIALTNLASLNLSGNRTINKNSNLWFLTTLTSLDLSYCYILIDLECLTYLTSLKSLNLSFNSCLEDTAMSNVSSLINLTFLNIKCCDKISNTGVSYLSSLMNLTDLNIGFCHRITEMSVISSLTNIISLDLSQGIARFNITDEQWVSMRSLTNITSLNLYDCGMSYNIWSFLCELTNLTSLCLAKSSITDKEVESNLSNLTTITSLDLSSCQIITINSLCEYLTNIVCLDLSNCCLDDNGISCISSMTNIEKLALCSSFPTTKVDKSALFTQMINLTDAALIHVSSLKNLKSLSIPCNNSKSTTNCSLQMLCNLIKLEKLFIFQINRYNNDEIDLSQDVVNKFVSINVFNHMVKISNSTRGRGGGASITGFKHILESRILKRDQQRRKFLS